MSEARTDSILRTRTLARIVGPYMIVMGAALLARLSTLELLLPTFMQDGPLVLATGAFTTIIGLCIIAAHHHFTSAAASVISVIGIAAALKGAWLLIAPEFGALLTAFVVRTPPVMALLAILMILAGAWLTFVGWFAQSKHAHASPGKTA